LSGEWRFALDPLRNGMSNGWMTPPFDMRMWDVVSVPHSWPADRRYPFNGVAWYRREFTAPPVQDGENVRLRFGAVFARARVWLNGTEMGTHEGGYTPFEFDVTRHLRTGSNALAVEADNSWNTKTMPGARPGKSPNSQVYPYFPWGGINREVELIVHPAVHIANARILAEPDLTTGVARLRVTAWIRNTSSQSEEVALACDCGGRTSARVAQGATAEMTFEQTLPATQVQLWDLDHPRLSRIALKLGAGHERSFTYGVRKVEVRGTELLLNGRRIRLGGANRAGDHPRFGLVEPLEVVEQDGKLLKEAGLELARLQHYAIPTALLDWADRNGLLIVAEAAQWGFTPDQLDDASLRSDFERQHREMVERDWNHPSIIAWSVGNEYASDTPSGVRWTKDMIAFTRALDPSRPVTFAGFRADRTNVPPDQEGSAYADFVMINIYGSPSDLAKRLDFLHSRYPDKPILISEYGIRLDHVKSEDERVAWFAAMTKTVRERPWIVGASVWSFNDYRSLYPGTNPSGFRPWGLVDEERRLRESYRLLAREHQLLTVEKIAREGNRLRITLRNRPDYPSITLEGARLSVGGVSRSVDLPKLNPGGTFETTIDVPAGASTAHLVVRRANGWIALDHKEALPQ
jgi:beta-glucuronidase